MNPLFYNEIQALVTKSFERDYSLLPIALEVQVDHALDNVEFPQYYPKKLTEKILGIVQNTFKNRITSQAVSLFLSDKNYLHINKALASHLLVDASLALIINTIVVDHINGSKTVINNTNIQLTFKFTYDSSALKKLFQYKQLEIAAPSIKVQALVKSILHGQNYTSHTDNECYSKGWVSLIKEMPFLNKVPFSMEDCTWPKQICRDIDRYLNPFYESSNSESLMPSYNSIISPPPHIKYAIKQPKTNGYIKSLLHYFIEQEISFSKVCMSKLKSYQDCMKMNQTLLQNYQKVGSDDIKDAMLSLLKIPFLQEAIVCRQNLPHMNELFLSDNFIELNFHIKELLQFLNLIFDTNNFSVEKFYKTLPISGVLSGQEDIEYQFQNLVTFFNDPTPFTATSMVFAIKKLAIFQSYEILTAFLEKSQTSWSDADMDQFVKIVSATFGVTLATPDRTEIFSARQSQKKFTFLERSIETMVDCLSGNLLLQELKSILTLKRGNLNFTTLLYQRNRISPKNLEILSQGHIIISENKELKFEDKQILLQMLDILYGKSTLKTVTQIDKQDVFNFFKNRDPLPGTVSAVRAFLSKK